VDLKEVDLHRTLGDHADAFMRDGGRTRKVGIAGCLSSKPERMRPVGPAGHWLSEALSAPLTTQR